MPEPPQGLLVRKIFFRDTTLRFATLQLLVVITDLLHSLDVWRVIVIYKRGNLSISGNHRVIPHRPVRPRWVTLQSEWCSYVFSSAAHRQLIAVLKCGHGYLVSTLVISAETVHQAALSARAGRRCRWVMCRPVLVALARELQWTTLTLTVVHTVLCDQQFFYILSMVILDKYWLSII